MKLVGVSHLAKLTEYLGHFVTAKVEGFTKLGVSFNLGGHLAEFGFVTADLGQHLATRIGPHVEIFGMVVNSEILCDFVTAELAGTLIKLVGGSHLAKLIGYLGHFVTAKVEGLFAKLLGA